MKANELNCKDLMIGDWVIPHIYDSKLEPSKIRWISGLDGMESHQM